MSVPFADLDPDVLCAVIEHVFMPPKLPQAAPGEQFEQQTNVALCHILLEAARKFLQNLPSSQRNLWMQMIKMLELTRSAAKAPFEEADLQRVLSNMAVGDVFIMHIRAQNAAIIVRRLALADFVQFEIFEVSPLTSAIMSAKGKLLCSYPGPAIQVPGDIFTNECFLRELSSFLVQMDIDILDSTPTTSKAGSSVYEVRESAHPRYISELLVGILRGCGQPAVVDRITKRIGDEVLWHDAYKPWRRSPLWLILRVSLQSSLRLTNLYKTFMLFFHAYLLWICTRRDFPGELLYAMRVKMARRLSKLGPSVSYHIYEFLHDTARETEAHLQNRWSTFQTIESICPPWHPEGLDLVADSCISLDTSYQYLTTMLRSASHSYLLKRFTPSHGSRLYSVHDFTQCTGDQLAMAIAKDQRIALADFELSVERHLDSWVAASLHNDDAPDVIASCIGQYFSGANDLYGANAEDDSIMILTIMDLWVALDTLATQQCPLLKQYSPEIPPRFLQCLLLHRSGSLNRALIIEEYLCRRHKEALGFTSVFSNSITDSCFAVQYLRTSENLQRIYDDIGTHALQERAAKLAELASLNQQSKSLSSMASTLDHERTKNRLGHDIHCPTCQKCKLEYRAKTLKIRTHEWPLPPSTLEAQLTVFELSPPRAFSTWRDITYMILRDIGMSGVPNSRDQPKVILDSFSGLSNWAVRRHPSHRITVGSMTKSFSDQTHYKMVGIPAEESSVLVNNGLSLRLFDRIRKSWVVGSFSESSVEKLCTPPVPASSSYSHLHPFVSGTQHTSNEVIAAQSDCPKDISLQEFIAFAGLRSGPLLQWLNIAKELASPSLSFRREEVHTLITQAAWQLGPLTDGIREWHVDLCVSSFGMALLRELGSLLEKIRTNWLEEVTVRTIALLSCRLLASTRDQIIYDRACGLLRRVRDLTYRWMCELGKNLDSTQDEISRAGLRHRLCMLAVTCFSTLDVGSEHISSILARDEDFSIAIQCAVVVHDNTPSSLSDDSSLYLSRMLNRHRRLLHFLEPLFSQSMSSAGGEAMLSHAGGYDHALTHLWPGYHRRISSNWRLLPRPNSRWISCLAGGGQEVHYDLLTGQLLINGKPLGRLPQEIVEHPTYASILGTRILDMTPADIPGVEFMTRSTVSGHQILFSRRNGDVILHARRQGDSQLLQLIPRSTFIGDFPRHFIDDYIHWLDLSTGEVEFRPAGSPWTSDPSNWRLYIRKPGFQSHFMLRNSSQDDPSIALVDVRSSTFNMVSNLLSSLESPEHIIVAHTDQVLEASLPRFHLSFFVNKNSELECRSMPGYVVDTTQSCGTMFGLKNRLVLCPSSACIEESILPRRVIIPQGDISFTRNGDFTSVSINTDTKKRVRWHEYTIDTDLGCLTSNASLSSKLYKCYLHALTSYCLPDPLLGHTGTEEALYILRSAACRSFQRLDTHDAKIVELISKLSPDRVYYPPHLQTMVTVNWNDLPALSQHDHFHPTVCSLLDHARALEALYDRPGVFDISNRNVLLLDRATRRNKMYYPQELQILGQLSSPDDVKYKSRDVPTGGTAEYAAYRTSWSIWNDRPFIDRRLLKLWDVVNSWGSLGPASGDVSLRYSRYWLNFDAARDWFAIYGLCLKATNGNLQDLKIRLSFCLPAAAYSKSKHADIVPLVIIFAMDERFRDLSPPPGTSYILSDGLTPGLTHLKDLIFKSALHIHQTPAQSLEVQATKKKKIERQRMMEYDEAIKRESSIAAQSILSLWPDYVSADFREQWFNKSDCNRRLQEYFQSISQNIRLKEHILQLEAILKHYRKVVGPPTVQYVFSSHFMTSPSKAPSHSIHDILVSRASFPPPSTDEEPPPPTLDLTIPSTSLAESNGPPAVLDKLESLIEEFRHSQQPLLQLYGNDLKRSHGELSGQNPSQSSSRTIPSHESLRRYRDDCSVWKDKLFSEISAALAPSRAVETIASIAGLWPRITPRSILGQLVRDQIRTLPDQSKLLIKRYAIAFLKYQQSKRLLELSSRQQHEELLREAETIYQDVTTESTPDWLLIQIEANILARPIQLTVTREMISPSSKRSISLQLNMGEGKSSVIVPLVASTLADGSNLVRVVTLKPLSNQMFQLLTSRLSGLSNRPVFYIPFSRSLRIDASLVKTISDLYRRCVAEGGVLVVQPEHILSQKLMHVDIRLTSHTSREKRSVAHELEVLQDWVAGVSRDVLDESDEVLHVRYQLVYTAGQQMPIDDHPNRWVTIQQVFSRLQAHAVQLRARFPKMFELDQTQRGFPTMRILDFAISREISSLIVDDALGGGISNLALAVLPSLIRGAARRFIVQKKVSDEDHDLIHSHCSGTSLLNGIILLRGLLMDGEGILGYVLKERRWRVDYGLDPTRTLLAVPYRAKDVPSLKAEFGHPDVAIALTCLSYYYGGLTKDQVLLCFDMLAKLDNPDMEYDHWVEICQGLPAALCQLNGVNTKDETQVNQSLVPSFSRNKRVVDFYLTYVVFPRAAREFPSKLPTSAWDLVEDKKNVTTGFSGTNDNRYLLPTSIAQEDPISELSTNALVLQRLIRPENDHYECTEGENGEREFATTFLQRLVNQDPEIRVLLDVGAQMLELQNEELARHWLSLRSEVSAAVFFNDWDHLTVLSQDGTIEPLISSPFNRQLDKCVVYLDDAHTRGTDLKLPRGTRAAVTLGPKVTKDRLVQGCMRLRQLGKGQSVMFFAPGDVDRRIRSHVPSGKQSCIRVLDILCWAMHETCEDIRHHLPHWAQQGLDHHKRFTAYKDYSSTKDLEFLRNAWLQPESRTLQQMYDPVLSPTGARTNPEIESIPALRERMERLGVTKMIDVRMAEEQEREVNHEFEQERQIERPSKVQPAQHVVHEDIREFAYTGKLPRCPRHLRSLFALINMDKALDSTTEWSPSPLATVDFAITIINSNGMSLTDYLRPVNWVLSSGSGKDSTVVVISPHEANALLPIIRKSKEVRLHLYAPRVTLSMRSFSDLTFYCVPDSPVDAWSAPAHIKTELNLFAGQLYFDSKEEYERVCVLLALSMAHPGAEYNKADGFVPPAYRTGGSSPITTSKIAILKRLIGLRRKGMGYDRTHLGRLLDAHPLSEESFSGMSS